MEREDNNNPYIYIKETAAHCAACLHKVRNSNTNHYILRLQE